MSRFEQFIKERKYLHNVTPATIKWHEYSLASLGVENPTADDLKSFVIRMREAGLSPESCNTKIRSVNAYLRWLGSPLHVDKLKVEELIPPTYTNH
jgi:integrase/recombinase XerD